MPMKRVGISSKRSVWEGVVIILHIYSSSRLVAEPTVS